MTINVKTGRIGYFDGLKLFAIFLVILGHVLSFLSSGYNTVCSIIYSFHMPLFMTIVGFFAASCVKKGFFETVMKRGKRLLVPVVTCAVIDSLIIYLTEGTVNPLERLVTNAWFLKTAFMCTILYYVTFKLPKPYRYFTLVVGLVASQFLHTHKFSDMYPFFLVGVGLKYIYIYSYDKPTRESIVKIIYAISGVVFVGLAYILFVKNRYTTADIRQMPIVDFITGFSGTIFFITLFSSLAGYIPTNRFTRWLLGCGQLTLGVYIVQYFIIEVWLHAVVRFPNDAMFNIVIAPMLSIAIFLACVLLIRVMQKSKIISFLVLGE